MMDPREDQIAQLKEELEQASRREEQLLSRLNEYESSFYRELNAQADVYRKTWTWRIGRLFVEPADRLLSLFRKPGKTASAPDAGSSDVPEGRDGIAVIFDTFTYSCFSPEFSAIQVTPDNWRRVFEKNKIRAVFVESAWRGEQDSWKDKIASISAGNQSDLVRLLEYAEKACIPRIFWNKEDPVHFGQFINLARHFDLIYTTDAGCVEGYRKEAPKATVHPLPFAAQPALHNPAGTEPRDKTVCFAGTYYDHRYHERRSDMDMLLKPALDYGLEIYDRHFGDTGKEAAHLRFPEIYQGAIRGKLDYNDMVQAYKRYKVFLNVNSVKYSPTMFARRVFELLACGTPVISNYSKGIVNLLGEGTVLFSGSEKETRDHLEKLLHDEQYWWKISIRGMRAVMEQHTYHDRAGLIMGHAGLTKETRKKVAFCVLVPASEARQADFIRKMLEKQTYREFQLVFADEISLEQLLHAPEFTHLALMHPGHYYGPDYLRDFAIATAYAGTPFLGKASYFTAGTQGMPVRNNEHGSFRYVGSIPDATLVAERNAITVEQLQRCLLPGEFKADRMLSIDPFNYLHPGQQPLSEWPSREILNKTDLSS